MKTENWKPEVGKTAWVEFGGFREGFIREKHQTIDYFLLASGAGASDGFFGWFFAMDLYPTPEAALASIKVYDLKGEEAVITRDSSEIDLLASEGRILSPFELEFYNFCKKDPNMVAEFAMTLLHPKSAEGGESPTKEAT